MYASACIQHLLMWFSLPWRFPLRLKVRCILAVEGGKPAETARCSSNAARVRISPRGAFGFQTVEATQVSGV